MDIRGFLSKGFSSTLKVVTNAGVKAVTGPVKDISATVKDVAGIRRDLVETKLAQFKVEEHESLIQKATLEDIKGYDPKTRRIVEAAEAAQMREEAYKIRFECRLADDTGAPLWLKVALVVSAEVCFLVFCMVVFGGSTLKSAFAYIVLLFGLLSASSLLLMLVMNVGVGLVPKFKDAKCVGLKRIQRCIEHPLRDLSLSRSSLGPWADHGPRS